MTDMQIVLPADLHELDLALGRCILQEVSQMAPTLSTEFLDEVPGDLDAQTAKDWCRLHRRELRSLARFVTDAAALDDAAGHTALASLLTDNVDGFREFLMDDAPLYLRQLVWSGVQLHGEEFQKFLKLLQLLPR